MFRFYSPYEPIGWTKRYVRHRKTTVRQVLRRLKYQNRVHKRPINLLVIDRLKAKRKPFCPHKPERRNYNTVYGPMQIPCRRQL